jgi:uncharacterized membrane protein YjjP (DUF1212 family)
MVDMARITQNHIIIELCEKGDYKWKEAEAFIRQIEHEHCDYIQRLRQPLCRIILVVCQGSFA